MLVCCFIFFDLGSDDDGAGLLSRAYSSSWRCFKWYVRFVVFPEYGKFCKQRWRTTSLLFIILPSASVLNPKCCQTLLFPDGNGTKFPGELHAIFPLLAKHGHSACAMFTISRYTVLVIIVAITDLYRFNRSIDIIAHHYLIAYKIARASCNISKP